MRGRSLFTVIGIVVVLVVAVIVIYFAWVGWDEEGRPVPDVDTETKADR